MDALISRLLAPDFELVMTIHRQSILVSQFFKDPERQAFFPFLTGII